MSLSLTTPDWMMLTRLIYRMNCLDTIDHFQNEVLKLLAPVVPYYKGIFNLAEQSAKGVKAHTLCGFNFSEDDLNKITQEELNNNRFLQGLCLDLSAKVSRGPSANELDLVHLAESDHFPKNAQHSLTMILQFQESLLGYLMLFRRNQDEEFNRRDMCVLDELQNHLSLQLFKLTSISHSENLHETLLKWELLFSPSFLSKKEVEVLYYFHDGLSDLEICDKLFISKSTFKKHLNHIYQKVKIGNRVDLLKYIDSILNNVSPKQ